MPIFRYQALNEEGKKITGVIDADSIALAKEKLLKQKILITKLFTIEQKEIALEPPLLLAFTRELNQLLSAGLPLYESLLTIEEKYRRNRAHPLFLDLCDRLKNGHSLSSSLKTYPKTFDHIYLSMVEAGERIGALPWVFEQLHLVIQRRQKLKKQFTAAIAYPAFLAGFSLLIMFGLLLFVIPSMRELFEGRSLHPLTQLVLSSSQFVENHLFKIVISVTCLVAGLIFLYKKKQGQLYIQIFLSKLPILNGIFKQAALVRFCRSSSLLLFGGVPLVETLSLCRKITKHPSLEIAIAQAEKKILEGASLSKELKGFSAVPPLVVRMLAIAEETGQMAPMLKNIAEIYEEQLEQDLLKITTFLQPVLLIFLGVVVGMVILSILLPLTDVSSLISS